jgi:hypothetical protein
MCLRRSGAGMLPDGVIPAPNMIALLHRASVAALIALLPGCMGPSLTTAPARPVDLSGHWVLDSAASDDTRAALKAALPAHDPTPPKPRPQPDVFDTNQPPPNRGQHGQSQQQQPTVVVVDDSPSMPLSQRAQLAMGYVVATERIEISQSPQDVRIEQGDKRRDFPASDEPVAVTDRYGSRVVRAGWSGSEFVIVTSDHSHLSVEEIFRPGHDRETLELEVKYSGERMKRVHVRSLYRRASSAAPASDAVGPPVDRPH